MIRVANHIALRYAKGAESRIHVEADDLAGAALLAAVQGRLLQHGVIDELRVLGGDQRKANPYRNRVVQQIPEGLDRRSDAPAYVIRLALKKCGVLMLNACLTERQRQVIMLRYWHELTQSEVACELGLSYGRIGQLERAACKVIAAELAERGIKSMRDVI